MLGQYKVLDKKKTFTTQIAFCHLFQKHLIKQPKCSFSTKLYFLETALCWKSFLFSFNQILLNMILGIYRSSKLLYTWVLEKIVKFLKFTWEVSKSTKTCVFYTLQASGVIFDSWGTNFLGSWIILCWNKNIFDHSR